METQVDNDLLDSIYFYQTKTENTDEKGTQTHDMISSKDYFSVAILSGFSVGFLLSTGIGFGFGFGVGWCISCLNKI